MCQRSLYARPCSRIAEEMQLQAEEEWIVDALKRIKQQRNCLQIERLHLESLKLQLTETTNKEEREETGQQVSAVSMMAPALSTRPRDWDAIDEDLLCNKQELDLVVAKPVFEMQQQREKRCEFNMEEDDDIDEDDDDDDNEDVMIDMNLLMNGSS